MYQDAVGGGGGGVVEEGEAAEYHIMYGHYNALAPPTPQATPTTTLKLGQAGAKDGALAGMALAGGGALVPAAGLVDVPALPASPTCRVAQGGALAVASEGLRVAEAGHGSPAAVGGMEAAALVTSMVAPGECDSSGGGGRKVIVKLLNSNTFSLDIIADGEAEAAVAPHHVLARGGAALVHAKLAGGTIFPAQGEVGAGAGEEGELGAPPAHAPHQAAQEVEEGEAAAAAAALPCRVMWTCAYCSVMLATSEAMAAHQQECAKALGDLPPLDTTTSQATVDALMSPLRQQEEPTYHLKLEAAGEGHAAPEAVPATTTSEEDAGLSTVETLWPCPVCEEEFQQLRLLGRHLPSHSTHQLADALLQLTPPRQRVRPVTTVTIPDSVAASSATTTTTTTATTTASPASPDPLAVVAVDAPPWPPDHLAVKLEEENVDNPGDTPPQTPPQDRPPARRPRRRPAPRPQDRPERKRKPTRKRKEEEEEEEEEEEAMVEETAVETQGKEYHSITTTTITTLATTTTTTTITTTSLGAAAGPRIMISGGSGVGGRGSRDPHHCEVCNKKLSSRGNLAKHLIRHRTKKPFECHLCHATFNAKRDCRNHYLQHHTTERPNRCHICGKSYVDKSYLLAHMVFHRDQKAYSCELCGKKFNTSRCVTRHKKRHQEEKRFVCDICFRPFAVKGDLTSHKRKVHSKHTQARTQPQQQPQQLLPNTQQPHQPHLPVQPQPPDQQPQGKAKELAEFILPDVVASPHILPEQLLPSELSAGGSLGAAVTPKGGIFISGDPLAVSSLIAGSEADNGGGACSYGVTLAPTTSGGPGRGDVVAGEGQPAYIMINSSSADKGVATTSAGLSIMYTTSGPTLTQQVGDLDDIPQLSTSVGPSLVGGEGQLDIEGHLEGRHHPQGHGTATLTTGDGEMSTTHRGDLGLGDGEGGPGGVLVGGEDGHNPPSAHDPNPGFPLELISQTYQLDLQRSQPATSYLG